MGMETGETGYEPGSQLSWNMQHSNRKERALASKAKWWRELTPEMSSGLHRSTVAHRHLVSHTYNHTGKKEKRFLKIIPCYVFTSYNLSLPNQQDQAVSGELSGLWIVFPSLNSPSSSDGRCHLRVTVALCCNEHSCTCQFV